MRSLLRLLISLAAFALLASACSSTTVVSRDDRLTADDESAVAADPDSDVIASTDADDSSTSSDDTEPVDADADSADDAEALDRGSRQDEEAPLTPRQLEEAGGFGLGGAEQLAGLLADCQADNDMACDILFELSGFDTPEETAALNCGGRSDTTVIFCTEGIDSFGDELVFDLESEGLDEIVSLCRAGDYTACDFLYFRSPFESEYEAIGATCGDRVQVAVPDCRTFLAE